MSDPHEEMENELRSFFRRNDPVPGEVTEFAQAALGWRRLDADLAELLADSALQTDMALARGEGSRALSFRAPELTVDIEIADGTLLGQLAPAAELTVELQDGDGNVVATASSDALGRFRFAYAGEGRHRLRIVRTDAAPVETSWFTI